MSNLCAKSPKESAQILIGIHEQLAAASQYSMRVQSSVSGEADPYYAWFQNYAGLGTPVQSPNITCMIYPGRLYTFSTASNSWHTADVQFNIPPGYTLYMGPAFWPMTARTSFITQDYQGGNGNWMMNFYVMPSDGAAWLQPGYSRAPHVGDVTWAVSAGTLSCGASAGALRWRSATVSQTLLDSSSLNYASPTAPVDASSSNYLANGPVPGSTPTNYYPKGTPDQVATYYDSNGNLKYIGTNQVQIYIARNPGTNAGYVIQVYQAQAGISFNWTGNDPTQGWNFNGSFTDQYTISDPDYPGDQQQWAGKVQIARLDHASGQTEIWILSQSGNTTKVTETDSTPALRMMTLTSTPISGGRTETYLVTDGNGNNPALKKLRTFQNFPWGEELVTEIADPDHLALTTSYTYYNTTLGDGHYSKLQSVTNPDGSWVLYNYFDDFAHWGELASVSTPWQDAPALYTEASLSNCNVTTYNYAPQVYDGYQSPTPVTSVYQTLNAGTQTTVNGTVTAQTTVTPSVWLSGNYTSPLFSSEPMRTDTIQNYSSSGISQATVKTVFHNTSDPVYCGKLFSQVNPDGTKVSASYWKGSFYSYLGSSNWNYSTFAPSSTSATWVSNYLTGTSTQQDQAAVLYSTDGVTGGMAIDSVWMTPYKSYRRQTVTDVYGNPWYDVNEVFTGSGFQIISWHVTGYSWDGLLQTDQDSTGALTVRSYISGRVNYQTSPDGTQTQYFFDNLMRVIQAEQKGRVASGSYPSQGAVETYYTYDAASNVTQTTKAPASGGLSLTKSATYNLAGLPTSQTDASGLTTNYSYTNGGRTVTTALPSGSTKIADKHLDGSTKSITGNAQENQFSSSAVNADGTITTTTYLGASSSPRWTATQADWLGRAISQSQPSFGGGTLLKQSFYNTSGQLTKTTQTGMSVMLYQYDGLGQLQYSGLAVENNPQLDLGGTDRITETRSQVYVDSNNVWWNRTQSSVFNVANSSTPVLKSDVRQKLVPYPSTETDYINGVKITETDSYDSFGNLTVEVVNSGHSTALVTDTTTLPNSTVPKVSVIYNRLLESTQTPQNILTSYQYDGLDRETSEVDPRKGTSHTAYFPSGTGMGQDGQISSRTDAGSNTTSFTYDSTDGRLFSQTDPLGNTIYHAYDHAGREIKTWGTGTYAVEYAFDVYGAQIAMRTFRNGSINFGTSTWPLSDDGGDPQNPSPSSWANGDTTTWTFDGGSGLLTSKTDASSQSAGYTYNSNGKVATRTWARGVVTTCSYDPNTAERTGISYSDGTPGLAYTFDRLGHGSSVVQTYSGFTLTTGLQYNIPGKLTQETFDSTYFSGRQLVYQLDTTNTGTLGRTIGYELGTSSSPGLDQTASFGYDTDGRLNSVGLSGGPAFTYGFASNSNLIGSISDSADGWSQSRTWDPNRDLLDTIQTSAGGTNAGSFTYAYDSLGRRTSKLETGSLFARYPAGGLVDAYTYDSRSEVTGDQAYQSNNPSSLTTPVLGRGFVYAYDPIGNRTTSSVDTQQTSYNSNALNQITSRTIPGYYAVSGLAPSGATVTVNGTAIPSGQFDGQYYEQNVTANNSSTPLWITANLSSSLGGSPTANTFLPQSPETSTYDADGNLLSDGRWNYFWDAENRLKAIETFGNQPGNSKSVWNSGLPLIHIDFKYDYKGRRISKMVSNWNGSAFAVASETRYAYENWNLAADYSVSGSSLTFAHSYLWGIDLSGKRHGAAGVGGLLAMVSASGAIELPVYDANGNVEGLTDRSTGQLTAAYEYSAYGDLLRATGAYAQVNPFQFSSKYTDIETGFVYYGKRYYNPGLGRFLGRDPKAEKGGLHLYAFVSNNGVNRWDFLGMDGSSDLTAQYLLSLGIDPNANKDPKQLALNASMMVRNPTNGFSLMGHFGGSGGNFMSSFLSPIPGSEDPTFYSVGDNNPATDFQQSLPQTLTYTVNGIQYTVTNDPHAAPSDDNTAFTANTATGAFSEVPTGNVSIGTAKSLGTVGDDPINPGAIQNQGRQGLGDITPENIPTISSGMALSASRYASANSSQQIFGGFVNDIGSSGIGNTLQFGAFVGDAAGFVGPATVFAPVAGGMYLSTVGYLATGGSSATVLAGAFSEESGAFATGALASQATSYLYGAYASGVGATLATPQGQEWLSAAAEFVDAAWGPPGYPNPTFPSMAGAGYSAIEDGIHH